MLVHLYRFVDKLKASPARNNKLLMIPFGLAAIINLAIWSLVYFKLRSIVLSFEDSQAFIPLHYNIYLGVDLFGNWKKAFIPPGIGLLFLIINSILMFIVYNKKEILSYFLTFASLLVQLVLLISTILVILINI